MKAFQINIHNGKNILEPRNQAMPSPNDDEILLRHEAIGVNFIDFEHLRGPPVKNSFIPGIEAVGVIESVGKNISNYKIGQRVGYVTALSGAYAEYRVIKPHHLFPIPDFISSEAAALNLAKGMTAHYLMRRTFFIREDMVMLLHGAASNVGRLMLKLAREYKVKVIATVGSDQKKEFIKSLGDLDVLNYQTEDWVGYVNKITANQGVHVVYDLIGGDLLKNSLKCMMHFGLAVSVGNAMEKSHPISSNLLSNRSLFLTAPKLNQYKRDKPELMISAHEIFGFIKAGIFPSQAEKKYSFDQIPQALDDIALKIPLSKVILL